jgi:hypothetical protein
MHVHPLINSNKYSSSDWNVMAEAYKWAHDQIGHAPLVQKDRLARSIMDFFDRGIHDSGVLSTLAVNREMTLIKKQCRRGTSASFSSEAPHTPMDDYRETGASGRLLN